MRGYFAIFKAKYLYYISGVQLAKATDFTVLIPVAKYRHDNYQ
jgi:hypothetical protein